MKTEAAHETRKRKGGNPAVPGYPRSLAAMYIVLLVIPLVAWFYLHPSAIAWTRTSIPIVGSALAYAADPVAFLLDQREQLGDVFRVDLLVVRVTVLLGPSVRLDFKFQISRMLMGVDGVVEPMAPP